MEVSARQLELSQRQSAQRWRTYQETMEPWVNHGANVMGMLMPKVIMHSDGRLEVVYSEKDQALIDDLRRQLQEISAYTLKSLGLATPPGDNIKRD